MTSVSVTGNVPCDQVCVCPQCGHQIGWMFEPEDSAEAGLERPSDEGFIAVIVNKAGDRRCYEG